MFVYFVNASKNIAKQILEKNITFVIESSFSYVNVLFFFRYFEGEKPNRRKLSNKSFRYLIKTNFVFISLYIVCLNNSEVSAQNMERMNIHPEQENCRSNKSLVGLN